MEVAAFGGAKPNLNRATTKEKPGVKRLVSTTEEDEELQKLRDQIHFAVIKKSVSSESLDEVIRQKNLLQSQEVASQAAKKTKLNAKLLK